MGAYNADGLETSDSDDYRITAEQINRIRAELEAGERRQQAAKQASSSSARSDLSDATRFNGNRRRFTTFYKHQLK